MPATHLTDRLVSWASELDGKALAQAHRTATLPIIAGHVALMPDAHYGMGATVGSVVPTDGAVIPACVGVDIGCGMIAVRTDLAASDLPDDLAGILDAWQATIPAGVGQRHHDSSSRAGRFLDAHAPRTELTAKQYRTAATQLGTLGAGNHFGCVAVDTDDDTVWVVLHSGSRGIGNQLAQSHISEARAVARRLELGLEDPDLAWLLEGTPEFDHYIADLRFAQAYALVNREIMMDAALAGLFTQVGKGRELDRVNAHHNYTAKETWHGRDIWVTRKGAISARAGELGILPGSMGNDVMIVEGLGNETAWCSSAHGAGRRMSRNQARKTLTVESLASKMGTATWQAGAAKALLDEHPDAYKPLAQVVADQADLVRVRHHLTEVLNFKGTR